MIKILRLSVFLFHYIHLKLIGVYPLIRYQEKIPTEKEQIYE
jgi:hypothetical protein